MASEEILKLKKIDVFLKLKLYVESAHSSKVTMFRF